MEVPWKTTVNWFESSHPVHILSVIPVTTINKKLSLLKVSEGLDYDEDLRS